MSIPNYISDAQREFSSVESHKTHSVCAVILCLYLVCLHPWIMHKVCFDDLTVVQ